MTNAHSAPLGAIEVYVDDLETRLTAGRAGYLDNLNNAELLNLPDLSSLTAALIAKLSKLDRLDKCFDWYPNSGFVVVTGTWALSDMVGLENTSEAQGNEVMLGMFEVVEEADYTAHIATIKDSDKGIMSVRLDNSNDFDIDLYAVMGVTHSKQSVSLGTLTVGMHSVKLKCKDKNASSSSYKLSLIHLLITKT